MSDSPKFSQERRQLERFPAADLLVRFRRRFWFRRSRWQAGEAEDFTRVGVCLITDKEMTIGQTLTLNLTLRLDRGEVHENGVVGTICNKSETEQGFRYGVVFDYDANHHMRKLRTQARLGRMEGILDRMERLRERRRQAEALTRQPDQEAESGN